MFSYFVEYPAECDRVSHGEAEETPPTARTYSEGHLTLWWSDIFGTAYNSIEMIVIVSAQIDFSPNQSTRANISPVYRNSY